MRGLSPTQKLGSPPTTVFIVSGDKELRQALCQRSEALGARPISYTMAEAFFAAFDPTHPACLLLDIHIPSRGGLRLQQRLQDLGSPWPVLFVSETGTVPQAVQAMRAGAVDFLLWPLECPDLLEARLKHCLDQARARQERQKKATAINARLARLSPLAKVLKYWGERVVWSQGTGKSPQTLFSGRKNGFAEHYPLAPKIPDILFIGA